MSPHFTPTVLVAPLDWGLGHATRMVPLIHYLRQHCKVILAGEGAVQELLKTEFPDLLLLPLPGYRVHYSGKDLRWSIAKQFGKIRSAARKEQSWLRKVVEEHGIHAVISDNRYGLWHPGIETIFITHQLSIITGLGKTIDSLVRVMNYRMISRFSQCWIPDHAAAPGLAGRLSHPEKLPSIPVRYLGPLSRFKPGGEATDNFIIVMLSGPEPQRSFLENKILAQLEHHKGRAVLLRGKPGESSVPQVPANVSVFNHLSTKDCNSLMEQAGILVSRSGYSTVMDASALNKRCIFIPTPGQGEQEYLAQALHQQGIAMAYSQEEFDLAQALSASSNFPFRPFPKGPDSLETAVAELVRKLQTAQTPVSI